MGNYFNKMSNKVRDESFSIELPLSNIVLTRYLYLKDEVKLAFLVSLLNKSDDAIFWAYELYYSGFKMEFFDYIWTIYYDFFATLNPSFEQYLNKMLKFDKENDKKIGISQKLWSRIEQLKRGLQKWVYKISGNLI